jgi:hypothetical protein
MNERLKMFWDDLRQSYHFEYVKRAVQTANDKAGQFETLLREHHQRCTMALGRTNFDFVVSNVLCIFAHFSLFQNRNIRSDRQSDGSLEERISQHSRESSEFTVQDENAKKLR